MRWQPIHNACWAGDPVQVARLLDAGADPNQVAPTNWRQTPLGRTLEFRITSPKHAGHLAFVRILLERGANPAARSTYLDMTPYELACFAGLLRPFQQSAPPHPTGMTELWLTAAHAGHFRVADALLDAGANPNAGTSLLHAACDWHFQHLLPALTYLARHRWAVNSQDVSGQTALHQAAALGYVAALAPQALAHRVNKSAAATQL